jgi:hypothetical protein
VKAYRAHGQHDGRAQQLTERPPAIKEMAAWCPTVAPVPLSLASHGQIAPRSASTPPADGCTTRMMCLWCRGDKALQVGPKSGKLHRTCLYQLETSLLPWQHQQYSTTKKLVQRNTVNRLTFSKLKLCKDSHQLILSINNSTTNKSIYAKYIITHN